MSAPVELTDVSFRYGDVTALERVSLRVDRGDFLGIVGPNGSGKTTLLRLVLGLLVPATGTARLFGEPATRRRPGRRVAYVPQRAGFDRGLPATVAEVVETGLAGAGWLGGPGRQARRRVQEALEHVGLAHRAGTRVSALSGGETQRVLIARALVADPALLLLDEVTDGVDRDARAALCARLRHLRREGVTVMLVSHDLDLVSSEATVLACVDRRLAFLGRPQDFRAGGAPQPASAAG